MVDQNKIKVILTRGVEEVIDRQHLERRLLSGERLRIKFGIDPTAPELHLGNAVILWKLKKFQELGHKIVFIIGDFTAQIGDPTGRLTARKPLTKKEIKENMKTYKNQLGKILNLKKTEIVYNSKHLSTMSFTEIYRISHFFSANQILERDMFQERKEKGRPIWLHEFFYPVFQAYDSVAVKADVEIGGNDQLFNMMMGRQLQPHFNQPPQDILTMRLLSGTDGRKMSKSFGNYIGIQETPNEMYGKIMSIKDELITDYFELCTFVPMEEISEIEKQIKAGANPRDFKAKLAFEVVKIYHGERVARKAEEEFNQVFKEKRLPSEVKKYRLKNKSYKIIDLLVKTKLVKSRAEARRLVEQRGVKIDGEIIDNWQKEVEIHKGMIIQVGPRRFVELDII